MFIAPDCVFSTAGHPLDTEQRNQGLRVWISAFWSAAALMGGSALQFCISFLPIDIIPSLTVEK